MQKRIDWVDIFKGITIILVVIGHTNSPIGKYIYLFHMAAFFFISGYTTNLDKDNFLEYCCKKIKTLLVPFIGINMLFFLIRFLLKLSSLETVFYTEPLQAIHIKQFFVSLTTVDLAGATWFLIVLFQASIMAKIINTFINRTISPKYKFIVMFCVSITSMLFGYFLYTNRIIYRYLFDLSFLALFYFILGYIFNQKKILVNKINHVYAIPICIFTMLFFGNYYYIGVNWPTRSFTNPFNNALTAFSGIYLIYHFAILICKVSSVKYFFIYIGQKSLAILGLHFLAFRICFFIFYLLGMVPFHQLQSLVPLPGNNHWIIITSFSIFNVVIMDYLIAKNSYLQNILFGSTIGTSLHSIQNR